MKTRGKILIFVGPEVTHLVTESLNGYDLILAHKFDDAAELILNAGVDLFVIDILFDESQGMELIKLIRKDPQHRNSSIVVTQLVSSHHSEMLRSVVSALTNSQTISCYFEGELTDLNIGAVFRKTVERYLPSKKRMPFSWVSYADRFASEV
jgi:CheY-like chemotaxis protein